jgi:hypothetical protein
VHSGRVIAVGSDHLLLERSDGTAISVVLDALTSFQVSA